MSTAYEVAIYGEFFAQDLNQILHRLTSHCESSSPMYTREVVFEPMDAQTQRETGVEPVLLRCKKDLTGKDTRWIMYSYLKPESVRQHPEATVRPWAMVTVTQNAVPFASALGFIQQTELYKKGYSFRRGPVLIEVFQEGEVDEQTNKATAITRDTFWEVEVKTANPVHNTQDSPLSRTIDGILEVQMLMKGLLDLRRRDD